MDRIQVALLVASALLPLTFSCSEPVSINQFVKTGDRDGYGRYVFDVDMRDSLSAYNVDVVASFSCVNREFASFKSLPLTLLWESPAGQTYEGTMDLTRIAMKDSSYYEKSFEEIVGERLVPAEYGSWKLYVKAPEDSLKKYGLTGLGLVVSKENYGTRKAKKIQ